ncbi:acylphosphatase [Nitrosophilus kaiyonis]|uniref:acylphosphatase n=1 Tax=Nitrosophilus kaiyonis TaxID=2930200 RepID=UPI002490A4E3|nr:acylphosphatase [Nitrosophilus kaiyonis]
MKTYRFIVSGKVQGVWYRKFTKETADSMGISGYVRNLKNGNVEVVATMKKEQFNDFLSALMKGPPLAIVNNIDIEELNEKYDGEFEIIR